MYKSENLHIKFKPKDEDEEYSLPYEVDKDGIFPVFYLDHSCGEWIIGGIKEVQELIDDLQDLINSAKVVNG